MANDNNLFLMILNKSIFQERPLGIIKLTNITNSTNKTD